MSSILLSDNPTLPVLLQRVKEALLGEAHSLAQQGEFQLAISLRDTANGLDQAVAGMQEWEAKGYLLDIALGEEEDLDIEPPEDCTLR